VNDVSDQQATNLVRQLDAQLQAINAQLKTAPEDFRQPVGHAVIETRNDLRDIRTAQQLQDLSAHYRTDQTNQPTAVKLIRAQMVDRIDAQYPPAAPVSTIEPVVAAPVEPTVQPKPLAPAASTKHPAQHQSATPGPTIGTDASTPEATYVGRSRGTANDRVHAIDSAALTTPAPPVTETPKAPDVSTPAKRNLRELAPQPGELVVFQNGDQNRWGKIETRGDMIATQNKHQHPDGWQDPSGWRLRENPQGSHYQIRVTGNPHFIPVHTVTHTIDPKEQPDLPVDSIIEKGYGKLSVQSITWGQDAERLRSLAAGKPSMVRVPHFTDGWDLRDGIGTNNERNDPADRHKQTNYRQDQQPDVEYVRTHPKSAEQHRERHLTPTPGAQRLPTAGPHAMTWAANLDKHDPNQTRIIVAGSRDLGPESAQLIKTTLETKLAGIDPAKITIVHGAARGADQLAVAAARELGMRTEPHRADWNIHGKAAGPIRNQQMIDAGAHQVIAFVNKPIEQSRGTADLVGRAHRNKIPATIVNVPTLNQTLTPPTPTVPTTTQSRSLSR
jgi:hypothetical protein